MKFGFSDLKLVQNCKPAKIRKKSEKPGTSGFLGLFQNKKPERPKKPDNADMLKFNMFNEKKIDLLVF